MAGRGRNDTISEANRTPTTENESRYIHVTWRIRLEWTFDSLLDESSALRYCRCLLGTTAERIWLGPAWVEQLPELSAGLFGPGG
jgi:hypothetical protein